MVQKIQMEAEMPKRFIVLVSALLFFLACAVFTPRNSNTVTPSPTLAFCSETPERPNPGEKATYTYQNVVGAVTVDYLANGDVQVVLKQDNGKFEYLFSKDSDQWLFYVDSDLMDSFSIDEETTTYVGEHSLFGFYDGIVQIYTICK